MSRPIIIHAPATVANLVCGFDILGLCLEEPYDIMEMKIIDKPEVIIRQGDGQDIPGDPSRNTAGAPLLELIQDLKLEQGFEIIINKKIKPGSGIGSSAASAAGAIAGAIHLLGNKLNKTEMVRYAMAGEKIAAGVKHADNVAPAIFGGISLIRSIFPLDIVSIPAPHLFVTIIHPQIEVKTSDARQILKKQVLLKDAIKQWGNIAGLIAGFMSKDMSLISRSLEDVIIEPVRSILIPGFQEIKYLSGEAGALGGGISGSGPSIFMLSETKETSVLVEESAKAIYNRIGIECNTYVTGINHQGVKIIE